MDPVWNETLEWNGVLRDLLDDGLIVSVYDHDKASDKSSFYTPSYALFVASHPPMCSSSLSLPFLPCFPAPLAR